MQFNLVPHASTPPTDPPFKVWATVEHAGSLGAVASTNIWFGVGAPAERFVIPAGEPGRADELWQTTCFEAFLRIPREEGYREWNFAPSGEWAAYDFVRHREGRTDAEIPSAPYVRTEDNLTWWGLGATIAVDAGTQWELALSAILEEKDGTKSYWALAHPPGDNPDFHDPVCFAARLP
jgi:hypothetical protein